MHSDLQIDSIDKIILDSLMRNARTPFLEIARKCRISGAAIHQRVKKLKELGIIEESKFIINPIRMGFRTCSYIGVFLEKAGMYKTVIKELIKIPEVVEGHYTTGKYAIFLKVHCRDNQDLMKILNEKIQGIPGIASTETFISLEQSIDRQINIDYVKSK